MHDQASELRPAGVVTIEEVARGCTELREGDSRRFDRMAEVVLAFQRSGNPVYGRYCKALGTPKTDLPLFLPVEAFKHAPVAAFSTDDAELVFESSRTGSGVPSRHYVRDASLYERSAATHFERVFGPGPFRLAAYLPRYAEQGAASSLLYMIERLIGRFGAEGSGSVLKDPQRLEVLAEMTRGDGAQLVVFGAAFGLADLVAGRRFELPSGSLVVETGGMKTHQREMRRDELHAALSEGFGVAPSAVRSEYGMCELLSQAYTRGGREAHVFVPPPWMRAWVVDPADPFQEVPEGEPGALAVLDLANVYSASALLTQDRAVRRGRGFEVLGRLRGAELRGCNFLLEHV